MQRGRRWNRLIDFWLGIPLLKAASWMRRRGKRPETVRRVGIMCAPALGDTLLFSAVLQDVRAAFPDAGIVHFCMRQNLAAAEILSGADRRVVVSMTQPFAAIRAMRLEQLDLLLDFTPWQRITAFCTLRSNARFTAGFNTPGQHRGCAYDLTEEHRNDRHELENFRALAQVAGIASGAEPAVTVEDGPMALDTIADVVVFHAWAVGQKSWAREWPTERWVELAQRLAQTETLFAVTGGPADRERMEALVTALRGAGLRAEAFTGSEGFRGLVRLLRRTRVAVSVNTGVMHLAAIVGTPTVSLNGPTSARRWGAVGRCVANVGPADGSGGYLNLGFEFDGQPEDVMERISVDQAAVAAEETVARCGGAA